MAVQLKSYAVVARDSRSPRQLHRVEGNFEAQVKNSSFFLDLGNKREIKFTISFIPKNSSERIGYCN